jgi:hypothetical protein
MIGFVVVAPGRVSEYLATLGVSYRIEVGLSADGCRVHWNIVDVQDLPELHLLVFYQLGLDAGFDLWCLLLDAQLAVLVCGCFLEPVQHTLLASLSKDTE